VSDAGYPVIQVQEPTKEEFYAALDEAGLTWAYDDILQRHQHPGMRVDDDGTIALVLHTVRFLERDDGIDVVQVAMVLGPAAAVVARWPGDGLDNAFGAEFPERKDVILALIEEVHDRDTEAMRAIEERVDDCELEVLDANGQGTSAQSIYHLEHELLKVRRAVGPMVAIMDRLARKGDEAAQHVLAEWRDRYLRLVSQMEDIDNLLTSVLSVNLTLVSVRQNEDNRKIAAWGAIGIAPTAMAGIWGMNFRHMPELGWQVGYPVALASMVLVCVLLYRNFRRAGWL
jgi:magnesium transporter